MTSLKNNKTIFNNMYCNKCGKEIPDTAKFCKYCGNRISKNNAYNKSNDSSNNRNKIIIVAAIIIVLAIIGIAAGYLISNSENNSDDDNMGVSDGVSQVSLSAFPVSEAPNLAQEIANGGQANSVNFKGVTLNKAQICYILTKSIVMIDNGNINGVIDVGSPNYAQHPSGSDASQRISKTQYVDMSVRFSNWIENYGTVPNYIGINSPGVSDVSPSNMINICVEVLINYKNTGSLPSSAMV